MLRWRKILKLRSSCQQTPWRTLTSTTEAKPKPSQREKAWQDVQAKYAKYEHLVYSSYLEIHQNVNMSFRKRKLMEQVMKKKQYQNLKYSNIIDEETVEDLNDIFSNERTIIPAVSEHGVKYPKNWMDDYEFYEGATDEDGNINSMHGTVDPNIPPSAIPCNGCGAYLHCASSSLPGFIPMEIFKGRTDKELKTIVCQRCHFLKHYNIALDVEVNPALYEQTIRSIYHDFAMAVVIVDLLDFPASIWPGMQELLGPKRPVFVVGNKVDLLPCDSQRYLERVQQCLRQQLLRQGFEKLNIKHMSLISAKTGYGIEELITQLQKIWAYKGNVYLLGCTNVGKSSLFNILLNSDYCRPEASTLIRRSTTCTWPGTTMQLLKFPLLRPSEFRVHQRAQRLHDQRARKAAESKLRRAQALSTGSIQSAMLIDTVGRTFTKHPDVRDSFSMSSGTQPIMTLDERCKDYEQARWCFDTPGVMHPDQITNLLTTDELLQLEPKQMISPRALRITPGLTLYLAGLGRLDLIEYRNPDHEWLKLFVFASLQLSLAVTATMDAEKMYKKYLGSKILGLPCGNEERLNRWPGLERKPEKLHIVGRETDTISCDIVLSSAGWVGVSLPNGCECTFEAWTPHARGIHLRDPPLIPFAKNIVGKRIRNSLAYNLSKPFV